MKMEDFDLEKFDKIGTGLDAPAHYFDTFPDRLRHRITANAQPARKIIRPWQYAAAVALLFGLAIPTYEGLDDDEVDQVGIESYFADNPLSDETLTELLDGADISKITLSIAPDDNVVEDLYADNPNLEQYLTD